MDRKPYPRAVRLYAVAAEYWPRLDAAYPSVDLITLPPHRLCNFVYTWLIERTPPDKWDQTEYELSAPLPWQDKKKVTPMQAESEGEDFMALMTQVQGG